MLAAIVISMVTVDFCATSVIAILASRGRALHAAILLTHGCVSVAAELALIIVTVLFAAWSSQHELVGHQIALLAFSFASTAAVLALHVRDMARTRKRLRVHLASGSRDGRARKDAGGLAALPPSCSARSLVVMSEAVGA